MSNFRPGAKLANCCRYTIYEYSHYHSSTASAAALESWPNLSTAAQPLIALRHTISLLHPELCTSTSSYITLLLYRSVVFQPDSLRLFFPALFPTDPPRQADRWSTFIAMPMSRKHNSCFLPRVHSFESAASDTVKTNPGAWVVCLYLPSTLDVERQSKVNSYSFELESFGLKAQGLATEAHDTSAHLCDIDLQALIEVLGALAVGLVSAVVSVGRSRGWRGHVAGGEIILSVLRGLSLSLSLLFVDTGTGLMIAFLGGCHVDVLLLITLGGLISLVTLDVVDKALNITKQKFSNPSLRVLGIDLTLLNLVNHELLGNLQFASHHGRQLFEAAQKLNAPVPPNLLKAT
ncbi:hypothetical protein KCU61_g803, partial [Aureobasidium melanogenum]